MTWLNDHRASELLASEAMILLREGSKVEAHAKYASAAEYEEAAFGKIELSKTRTLGIIAVSAAALWFKAQEYERSEIFAARALSNAALPQFARAELRTIIQSVWTEQVKRDAGTRFLPGQVTVSVKGGEVVTGGAPLDLILDKVGTIQSLLYRTIEFVQQIKHRMGRPPQELREACRPWLFQEAPGSYQFSVAVQQPKQSDFFRSDVDSEQIVRQFINIVRASASESPDEIERAVPDPTYRATFLKLTRNLAPGKVCDEVNVRVAHDSLGVSLFGDARGHINRALRQVTRADSVVNNQLELNGVLRALHLDKGWLVLVTDSGQVQVHGLQSEIDDVIGPMVNRRVVVSVVRKRGDRYDFVDMELDE